LEQEKKPYFWSGLKFFNVYGPNEYHKGKMASVVFHAFNQIKEKGKLQLFESHKEGIPNGHQKRDFIYVKDLVDVLIWFFNKRINSGIYNLGSGKASTFLDLSKLVLRTVFKHFKGLKNRCQSLVTVTVMFQIEKI
jgi:ADP-L-glycero-D-manno-heptose 6-epimerase